ncbi:PAS domain S-box protein [Anabaena sphaerica FACHB-251]|uniref:protein-glutamate O-methyltransferase n=1 Tax=Anabaena sphaerica FACHB-251 TaxID=2692883 RepID=A0A926WKC0_9NOST|nr:CheR family methyltransferase [Anabaena sphaerica]MBD2296067.1 PAS domain S-box protein [Anabaena sphaerica FACHB-251]
MNSSEKNHNFENLLIHVRQNRGFDFTGYKRSTLLRRVNKRLQSLSIDNFNDYVDYLEVHPEEFNYLFNTILINVTDFFRDASTWEYLGNKVIPNIIKRKKNSEQIRIWSAGCASGEEAYTIAILLAEALGAEDFRQRVKIYATDIDEEALNQARQAVYLAKDLDTVPTELRDKYFDLVGNNYIFRQDLRRCVIFGRHNLFLDAPISRLDLLVCRNTLMYFNSEVQGRIMARFHFALNDTGYLFLGKAEMLLMYSNLFTSVDLKNRIFTKISSPNIRDRLLEIPDSPEDDSSRGLSKHIRLRELAFDAVPVAEIVINIDGVLVMLNEPARTLFGLSKRDLDRPFQDLELSYRPIELRSLIERAYKERRPINITNVERYVSNSEKQYLDVRITPLEDDNFSLLGVSITFNDVTRYIQLQEALQRSQQDLETTNEELQSTNEELETTNEELQSTNEELETTNEELQSTNQELETMNEELQSANEELQTINYELSDRTLEINRSNIFITSILKSLQTGMLVIDKNFNILIWHHLVEDLWGLRNDEVINKSLFILDIGLPVEDLRSPICEILAGKTDFQEMILDTTNRRGRQIKCYVALTPLIDKKIEGVVLIMADVDKIRSMISHQ